MAPSMPTSYLPFARRDREGLVLLLRHISGRRQVHQRAEFPVLVSHWPLFDGQAGFCQQAERHLAQYRRAHREGRGAANSDQLGAATLDATDENCQIYADTHRPDHTSGPGQAVVVECRLAEDGRFRLVMHRPRLPEWLLRLEVRLRCTTARSGHSEIAR